MLVRDLRSLAAGQRAVALVIAPNDKLRAEVVNYARGAVESKPELRSMLLSDEFALKRPDGHVVTFEAGVATRGGYGARGRALTDFALDECAFFRDSSYKVNDAEIFRAGSARVLPGGQTIVASTPWAETGLLYELWRDNWGKPTTALVAHAPTLTLHDSEMTRAIVEREKQRDPDNAKREFDAAFMSGGTTVFFEPSLIDAAVEEPAEPQPGDELAAGGDFGFRADSSALVTVARRKDVLHVVDVVELRPEEGIPLKPSRTVGEFAKTLKTRGISGVMADQHYRESITEHLETHDLTYMPAPTVPAEAYVRARMLLREGRVRLPRHDRLLQQMREVQGRPLPGGGMSIVHPRWRTGGHGDLVAALVLALYQVSGDTVAAPLPALGTKEWEERAAEKRLRKWKAEQEQKNSWMPHAVGDRGTRAWWRK